MKNRQKHAKNIKQTAKTIFKLSATALALQVCFGAQAASAWHLFGGDSTSKKTAYRQTENNNIPVIPFLDLEQYYKLTDDNTFDLISRFDNVSSFIKNSNVSNIEPAFIVARNCTSGSECVNRVTLSFGGMTKPDDIINNIMKARDRLGIQDSDNLILSFGGASGKYISQLAQSKTQVETLINSLVNAANNKGVKSLTLDFDLEHYETSKQYNNLMGALSTIQNQNNSINIGLTLAQAGGKIEYANKENNPLIFKAVEDNNVTIDYINGMFFDYGNPKLMTPWTLVKNKYILKNSLLSKYEGSTGEIVQVLNKLNSSKIKWKNGVQLGVTLMDGLDDGGELLTPKDAADLSYDFNNGADKNYGSQIKFFSFWSAERDNGKLIDTSIDAAKKNSLLHSRSASSGIPQHNADFINALKTPTQLDNTNGLIANMSQINLEQAVIKNPITGENQYTGDYETPSNLKINTSVLKYSPTVTYKDLTGFKITNKDTLSSKPLTLISSYLHPTETEKLFGIPSPKSNAIGTGAVGLNTGYLAFLGKNRSALQIQKGTLYNKPFKCKMKTQDPKCRISVLHNYDDSKQITTKNNLAWVKLSSSTFDWGSSTQKTKLTYNDDTTKTKLNFSKNEKNNDQTIYRRLIDKKTLKDAITDFNKKNKQYRAIISSNYNIITPELTSLKSIQINNIGEGQSDNKDEKNRNIFGNPVTSSGVVKISKSTAHSTEIAPMIVGEKTITVNQGCHNTTITWNPTINGDDMVHYNLTLSGKTQSAIQINNIPTTGVTIMENLKPGTYTVKVNTTSGANTSDSAYTQKTFVMDHCAYIAPVTLTDSNSITMKQNTTPTHSQMEVFFPASKFLYTSNPQNDESLNGSNPIATTPEYKKETYLDLYNDEYNNSGSQSLTTINTPTANPSTDNIKEIKFDVVAPTLSNPFADTDSLVNLANVYPQSPMTYTGENVASSDASDQKTQRDNDYSTHSQSDKLFDGWFIANKSFWKTTVTQGEITPPNDPKTISANKDYPKDFTNNKSGIYYGLVSGFSSQYSQIKMALAAPQQTTAQQQGNLIQMTHMTWSFNANKNDAQTINNAYANEKSNPSIASQFVLQNNQGQDIWQVDTQQDTTKICNKKTDSQGYTCEIPLIWAAQIVVKDSNGNNQNKGSALLTPQACAIWPTNLMQAGTPIHCDPQSTETGIRRLFTNGYSLSNDAEKSSAVIRQNNNWGTANTIVNFLLNSQSGLGHSYLYDNIGKSNFDLHVSSLNVQNTGTTRYTVTYKPVNDVKTNDHETNDENYNLTNTLPLKNLLDTINKSYNTYRAVDYKDPASTSAGLQDGRHGLGFVFDLESPNSENYMTPTYVKGTMSVFSKPLLLSSKDKNPPAAKFYPKATPTPLITGANDKDDKSHIKSCTVRIEATGGAGGTSTKTAQSTLSIRGDIFLSTEACKAGANECASTNNDATINGDNYYLDLSNFKDNGQNLQIAGAKISALMTSIEDYVDDKGKSIVWDDETGTLSNPSYHKLYGITRGPLQTLPEAQLRFGFSMNYAKNTDTIALDHWNNIKTNKTVDLYYNMPMKSESGFQENNKWYNDINSHNRVNPYIPAADVIHNYYKSADSSSQTKPNIGSVVKKDDTTGNEIGTMGDKIQCKVIYSTRNEDIKPTLTLSNARGVLKKKDDTASITATVTNAPEDCTNLGPITATWTKDTSMPNDDVIDKTVISRGNDKWVQSGNTCVRTLNYRMLKPIDSTDNSYFPTLSLSFAYKGNTYTGTSHGIEFDGEKFGTTIQGIYPTSISNEKYHSVKTITFKLPHNADNEKDIPIPKLKFSTQQLTYTPKAKWNYGGDAYFLDGTITADSEIKTGQQVVTVSLPENSQFHLDKNTFTLTVKGSDPGPGPAKSSTITPTAPSKLAQGAHDTITFTASPKVTADNTITLANPDTGILLGDCTIAKGGTQSTDCTLTATSDAKLGNHALTFTDSVTTNTVKGTSVTVTGNTPKPAAQTITPSATSPLTQGASETITFTAENNVAAVNTIMLKNPDAGILLSSDCKIAKGEAKSTDCTLTANSNATPGEHPLNFKDTVTGNTVNGTSVTVNKKKPGPAPSGKVTVYTPVSSNCTQYYCEYTSSIPDSDPNHPRCTGPITKNSWGDNSTCSLAGGGCTQTVCEMVKAN